MGLGLGKSFPARESLASDIRVGVGNTAKNIFDTGIAEAGFYFDFISKWENSLPLMRNNCV